MKYGISDFISAIFWLIIFLSPYIIFFGLAGFSIAYVVNYFTKRSQRK